MCEHRERYRFYCQGCKLAFCAENICYEEHDPVHGFNSNSQNNKWWVDWHNQPLITDKPPSEFTISLVGVSRSFLIKARDFTHATRKAKQIFGDREIFVEEVKNAEV